MKDLKIKFRWETEFKETEIGEIPRDWEAKKLGDMATIKTGKTDVKDAVEDGEYPLFDRSDQIKRSNKYLFDTEAVIVPGEGKDFTPRYYKGKFDLHQRTYAIFDFKELNGKYLFFAMHILRHTLRDFAVGSTVESLRLPILKNLDIPYPPLSEQSRIATVLSWFDDLIEVKKRQNEILEKTAMAIFKSWFIDFEPFRDGEFVYSEELGKEIPKGWEVRPIEKEFKLIKGKKCKLSDNYFEGYSPYLLIETFKTGKIEFWTIEKEPRVDENDVVLVADGESSGKVLRYQKGILGSTLLTLKPKRENFVELKHLIYLTLKFYEDDLMSHRTGSAIPHLDKDFLKLFPILIPPSHILQSFHSLVEPLFQKIILNQKQIMTLRKIRDTLLPLLVFGKLRVKEV
jgi:type I restriction enzyme S subunit